MTLWYFFIPYNLIKLPILRLPKNLQEVFRILVVAVLQYWKFLIIELLFCATNTPHWLLMPVKASYNPELYHCHFLLIIFGGYFPLWFASFYQKRYGFEQSFFTHKHFLMSHSFPLFPCICHSDSSRKISSRVFLNACSHRVVPFG